MKFAQRLKIQEGVHWYTTLQLIQEREAKGVKVIRLGSGNPDMPTPPDVVEAAYQALLDPANHRYSGSDRAGFAKAIAARYRHRFGVELDPQTEIFAFEGSQAVIGALGLAVMEPGAVALVTDPCYTAYARAVQFAGGEVYWMPVTAEGGYLPDLSAIPNEVLSRARLLWLNYPNNPTGAAAPLSFFEEVVAFAREHDILVCHDNAYADVTYDGYVAPSFLEVKGAKEVGIELGSMSKAYNMAGWRLGMVVGNADALGALRKARRNTFIGGPFSVIQFAAVQALNGDQSWTVERNRIYQERRDLVVEGLRAAGLDVSYPKGTVFVWAGLPEGYQDSRAFSMKVLNEANIWLSSGVFFGPRGEGYVRISLTAPTEELREAMERIKGLDLS